MTYALIVDGCSDLPVEACRVTMMVFRSAFFTGRHRQSNPTARMLAVVELAEVIAKVRDQSFDTSCV